MITQRPRHEEASGWGISPRRPIFNPGLRTEVNQADALAALLREESYWFLCYWKPDGARTRFGSF